MVTAGIALFYLKCDMGEPKSIKELIDTYYPEITERLNNGKRERK